MAKMPDLLLSANAQRPMQSNLGLGRIARRTKEHRAAFATLPRVWRPAKEQEVH